MDERLKYEQLIGGKLQSLPVPDMQDAIWARIKAQLDIDLPTDDGDGGSSPQSPSVPKVIGWGLSIVIITLITVFFLIKNKPVAKESTTNKATTTEQIVSPAQQNSGPPLPAKEVNKSLAPVITENNAPFQTLSQDSARQQFPGADMPQISLPDIDNVQTNIAAPPSVTVNLPQRGDTASQMKKPRGMQGLTDSSYRIIPKN